MPDWAAIIVAGGGFFGVLGGGIRFVWNKVEARFQKIETQLEECHQRELQHQERRAVQLTVIELLWQEVKRLAPDAGVLDRAKRLLDGLKKEGR